MSAKDIKITTTLVKPTWELQSDLVTWHVYLQLKINVKYGKYTACGWGDRKNRDTMCAPRKRTTHREHSKFIYGPQSPRNKLTTALPRHIRQLASIFLHLLFIIMHGSLWLFCLRRFRFMSTLSPRVTCQLTIKSKFACTAAPCHRCWMCSKCMRI